MEYDCETCREDPATCSTVPVNHCEKALRERDFMTQRHWNYNMDEAPKDEYIWAASSIKSGRIVTKTKWAGKRQAWEGFTMDAPPIAWMEYFKPSYPSEA